MRRLLVISLLYLNGCGAERARVKTPPGYVQNGYCVPDGINAKTGKPDFLICKTKDGETATYRREH